MNATPEPSASYLSPSFGQGKIKKNRTERRERKTGNGKTERTRDKCSCFGEGAVHSHSLAPNSHPFQGGKLKNRKAVFPPKKCQPFPCPSPPLGVRGQICATLPALHGAHLGSSRTPLPALRDAQHGEQGQDPCRGASREPRVLLGVRGKPASPGRAGGPVAAAALGPRAHVA